MATPQELNKKAYTIEKNKALEQEKQLEILNKARQIKGYAAIPEKDLNIQKGDIETATSAFQKQLEIQQKALDSYLEYKKTSVKQSDVSAIWEKAQKIVEEKPKSPYYESEDEIMEKIVEKKDTFGIFSHKNAFEVEMEMNPFSKLDSNEAYVETAFKFSKSERDARIKSDPNLPRTDHLRRDSETNGEHFSRVLKEDRIRKEYIRKKYAEFDKLEDLINESIHPVEIMITDENEEFCVNAFELADNLTMSELEKDSNFSLDKDTELYNKTYDKYIQLITSFKLDKNA